jgi:hypothetical protein
MGGGYDTMYPELLNFFGAYFNQDFEEYGRTDDEVIATYSRQQRPEKRRRVVANLEALLKSVQSEEQLQIALEDFCSAYYLDPDTQSARDWLERIRDLLKAKLDS